MTSLCGSLGAPGGGVLELNDLRSLDLAVTTVLTSYSLPVSSWQLTVNLVPGALTVSGLIPGNTKKAAPPKVPLNGFSLRPNIKSVTEKVKYVWELSLGSAHLIFCKLGSPSTTSVAPLILARSRQLCALLGTPVFFRLIWKNTTEVLGCLGSSVSPMLYPPSIVGPSFVLPGPLSTAWTSAISIPKWGDVLYSPYSIIRMPTQAVSSINPITRTVSLKESSRSR